MKKFLFIIIPFLIISICIFALNLTASPKTPPAVNLPILNQSLPARVFEKNVFRLILDPSRAVVLNDVITSQSVNVVIGSIYTLNFTSGEPIYLLLNSLGGSVDDGSRLISLIEMSKAPVYTVVIGDCMSMCAEIHQHGVVRMMTNRSVLMFHPASTSIEGTYPEIQSRLNFSIKKYDKLNNYVADKANIPHDKFKQMIRNELFMDAEDATASGFNDQIVFIDFKK